MIGKKKESLSEKIEPKEKLTAKKDFVINQNEYFLEIKTGQDLSEVPAKYLENLKTEKVI